LVLLNSYFYLNLVSALFIFASGAIPILLSTRLTGRIRQLTIVLAIFIVVHGFYHVTVLLGYYFIGAGVLDPLSVAILISFGLFYLTLMRKNEKLRRKIIA
jgi:DMSO/TMAO reductase YedYZ heme-binding membrane subunit